VSVRRAFVAMVRATPGLTARLYPGLLPTEAETPALTYSLISRRDEVDHAGVIQLTACRFQVAIWGDDMAGVDSIAEDLLAHLTGLKGTFGGRQVDGVLPVGEIDTRDAYIGQGRIVKDWLVIFRGG
jgi:hypothetical protein